MITTKKLYILFIPFWYWYPNRSHPAQGASVQEQVRAVSKFHQATVLYAEPSYTGWQWHRIVSDSRDGDIRIVRVRHWKIPVPFCTYPLYLRSLRYAFDQIYPREEMRPDIIHSHEYGAGGAAVLLGRRYGIPVIISEHSSRFIRGSLSRRERLKIDFAMNRADMVLPVGEEVRDTLLSQRITAPLSIIPNAVDTSVFSPAGRRKTVSDASTEILLIALLRAGKGIPSLLRALAVLQYRREDFCLKIAGDGPKKRDYQRLTEELGLAETVAFLGLKTRPEVADLIRDCDFVVQPSEAETFGMTVIEAMACGKPVLASRLPTFQRLISAERGMLVSPGDEKKLAEAIDSMIDRYHEYRPEKLVGYVKDRFSHEAVGRRLGSVYEAVLSKRRR